jgi:oligosaccharide repeat unit polymerase
MVVVYCTLLILLIVSNTKVFQKRITAHLVFSIMWCLGAASATLGIGGISSPSPVTHLYILITIFAFNAVPYIASLRKATTTNCFIVKSTFINKAMIIIANGFALIILLPISAKAISIISSNGFEYLRKFAFDANSEYGNTARELMVSQWIVQPIFSATLIYGVICMFSKERIRWLIFLAVFDILLYTMTFGGRSLLLRFVVLYFFSASVYRNQKITNEKRTSSNKVLILLVMVLIILITIIRTIAGSGLLQNVILYFSGSFVFLDSLLQKNGFLFPQNPILGLASLGFLINPILILFSYIFGIPYSGSDVFITSETAKLINIGPNVIFNAFTTIIYPLYVDGGILFVLIGVIGLSIFVLVIERRFLKKQNAVSLAMYLYVFTIVFDSLLVYQLLFPAAGMTILFIVLFGQKIKFMNHTKATND